MEKTTEDDLARYYIQGALDFHSLSGYGNFPEPPFNIGGVPSVDLLRSVGDQAAAEAEYRALRALLSERRTRRRRGRRVSLPLLTSCLAVAAGRNEEDGSWPYPSAGNLRAVKVFLVAVDVPEAEAIYLFDPIRAEFDLCDSASKAGEQAALGKRLLRTSALDPHTVQALFLMVADLAKAGLRYGERSYRYALLEAGHMAQNLSLALSVAGVPCCPVGGIDDQEVMDLLEIDESARIFLYGVAVP
ncbi:SagB/ThcOx family dehydrogenase [Streptomyces sp. NPDC059786]|uniref:SagB/ThcOx family dehydrogenase n=1 Tax=Streptomyces sp. NPDC059786 TaxID=3346946 RepID=UPI00365F8159